MRLLSWLRGLLRPAAASPPSPATTPPRQYLHIPLAVRTAMPRHVQHHERRTPADYQAAVNGYQEHADREYPIPVRVELLVMDAGGLPIGCYIAVLPAAGEG